MKLKNINPLFLSLCLGFIPFSFFAQKAKASTPNNQNIEQHTTTHRRPASRTVGTEFRNPMVHDPVMIKEGNRYYLFTTGNGVNVLSSSDIETWRVEPSIFEQGPQWAIDLIPGFNRHIWAPDVIFYEGRYHVFYSCSAFGKNTSAIGHASTPTLDSKAANYEWIDHGMVLQSIPFRDMWNAIDPNIIIDGEGTPWMDFGSFWDGIKMVRLKKDLSGLAQPEEWVSLCRREREFNLDDSNPGNGAVEAPFIYKKGEYYYLFVSFDYCCRGKNSDYKIAIGRSKDIKGPYLDRKGERMDKGGGTILLKGNNQYAGVGHNAVVKIDGKETLVAHAYPVEDDAPSKLILRTIEWDVEGWPNVSW